MTPNSPLLSLNLITLALVLAGCFLQEDEPDQKAESLTVSLREGPEVDISEDYKICDSDSDCMLVNTGCDFCCQRQAINRSFESVYPQQFQAACTEYDFSQGICSCMYMSQVAKCHDRHCLTIEDSACFSPTQNLETAYRQNSTGCACASGIDSDFCLPDKNGRNVALICENNRWIAVEDGPCMPQM